MLQSLRSAIEKSKGKKTPTCKGKVFRANVSQYGLQRTRGKNMGEIVICLDIKMRLLKLKSCPGCEQCGWMDEFITEINAEDFPVEDIESVEDGGMYELVPVMGGPSCMMGMGEPELEYLKFVEHKENK